MKKIDVLKSYKERKLLILKQLRLRESLLQVKIDGITSISEGFGRTIQQLKESLGWIKEAQYKS